MRSALLAAIALLVAGCAGPGGPETAADVGTPEDLALAAAQAASPAEPVLKVLADVNRSYENPVPPPEPLTGEGEWVVETIDVADGWTNVTFDFWRSHVSADVWAANCRVYKGDRLQDQAAFSDAGIGQAVSEGTCTLQFAELRPGTYRAVYYNDGTQPGGTHDVRLRVTGWFLAPEPSGEGRTARA